MSKRNPFDKRREILRQLLVNARRHQKVTQKQLAAELQTTQSFVSKYENGDRLVDLVETHQICQALDYSFVELTNNFEMAVNEESANYNGRNQKGEKK
ncbi:MAG: XRE family transcriptional regulator [Gammaproteobacteria bacterium]|nr:MAG: XRE family transcriptional regulator [Gammaproteobacteria bacterium]